MSEQILINITPQETRVAVMQQGVVQELHIERASSYGMVGNVYQGRVCRVLPGMQSAFVEIGLERAAFLHVADIWQQKPNEEKPIEKLLHEGQTVLVQVIKDPIGTKGARLSTQISIAGRLLVYLPQETHIGISQRIEDEQERELLRHKLQQLMPPEVKGGFIVRTSAETATDRELLADVDYLQRIWNGIMEQAKTAAPQTLLYQELNLALRVLRDFVSEDIDRIIVDSRETYAKLQAFSASYMSDVASRLEHYQGERPLFDLYQAEAEIEKALSRKVELKSGGYLIIDQTEALTTVDVNTGAFVGGRNFDDTIFKTNLEAAHAIARQLRLRNLGGIIIIDFIDMEESQHRRQVIQAFERALASDHVKTSISSVSPLGLVEMTRKRTRESLEHVLCQACPTCEGRGFVKTAETVCYEVFREIQRQARQFECQQLMVLAHQDVIERLLDEESVALGELELSTGKPIRLQTEALYTVDQYDVVLM